MAARLIGDANSTPSARAMRARRGMHPPEVRSPLKPQSSCSLHRQHLPLAHRRGRDAQKDPRAWLVGLAHR